MTGQAAPAALRARLEARREEIEAAALTRVRAISDPSEVADPAYAEGLRAAVQAAISYGIETTGREAAEPPIPIPLLAQARMAARAGIPLDTVLRRYFAGYSLLGYFQIEEAGRDGLIEGSALQHLIAAQAGVFDRLLAAIGEEHARESELLRVTPRRRQVERIERLLGGEPLDSAEFGYDLDAHHLALLARGADASRVVRELAASLDCRLLLAEPGERIVWAWLGARRPLDPGDLLSWRARRDSHSDLGVSLGEPAEGLAGWRLTHHQAAAALPLTERGHGPTVRYRDVALLASAIKDDLLVTSLRKLYIEPLERDGGEAARETLRAYFAADRNVSSTAAALGVTRKTVNARLGAIETRIGRRLSAWFSAELDLALRLADSP